jgi:hypothetical protein
VRSCPSASRGLNQYAAELDKPDAAHVDYEDAIADTTEVSADAMGRVDPV